jgi:hypothetical protein
MERKFFEAFLDRQLLNRDTCSFYLRAWEQEGRNVRRLLRAVTQYLRTPASRRAFDIDLVDRESEPRLVVRRLPVLAA